MPPFVGVNATLGDERKRDSVAMPERRLKSINCVTRTENYTRISGDTEDRLINTRSGAILDRQIPTLTRNSHLIDGCVAIRVI